MSRLQQFLADKTASSAFMANRYAETGSIQPKGNYIAIALVCAASLPEFGENYTIGQGPAAPLTGSNIVAAVKELAFLGKGWFLGDGLVNGKSGKPTEMKESQAYGSRTMPRPTGEITEKVDFTIDDTFLNIDFWNSLRSGILGPLDAYLFTDKTVQVVRSANNKPVFDGIGSEIAGDYTKDITGGFSLSYTSLTGQLSPIKGVRQNDLQYDTMKYTFAAATPAPTNLTLVAGTSNRYNMITGSAAKIKRAVVEVGAVRYSIYKNSNEDIPTAELVTIDSDTGEVNFASGMPVGRYVYTVAAENTTGVFGTYVIEVIVKAS